MKSSDSLWAAARKIDADKHRGDRGEPELAEPRSSRCWIERLYQRDRHGDAKDRVQGQHVLQHLDAGAEKRHIGRRVRCAHVEAPIMRVPQHLVDGSL